MAKNLPARLRDFIRQRADEFNPGPDRELRQAFAEYLQYVVVEVKKQEERERYAAGLLADLRVAAEPREADEQ